MARLDVSAVGWAKQYTKKRTILVSAVPDDWQYGRLASYWDGGSKSEWALRTVAGGAPTGELTTYGPFRGRDEAAGGIGADAKHALPTGVVLVESGTFCGKPASLGIKVRRSDVFALLGIGHGTLDPDEQRLRAACWASPSDNLPFGVYADWLQEQGRGEAAAKLRAVFGY